MLEAAERALATGTVCDGCLGRLFADRSHGLTNEERGQALRVTLAMQADEPVDPPAVADCWVCEGRCDEYDRWAEQAVTALNGLAFETYQVGTRVPPIVEENDHLLREEAGVDPDAGEPFKTAFNREVGKRVGRRTGREVDLDRPDVLVLLVPERETVEVQVNPAFVSGRYRKLQRDVPQTEWPCSACGGSGQTIADGDPVDCPECDGTGYRYQTSVEQEIAPVVRDAMDGREATFHGAGREDVDALMLGTGRPFVVEVTEPVRRFPDVEEIAATIEAGSEVVEVEGLRLATYDAVERVKELPASKRYRVAVEFDDPVDADALAAAVEALEGVTVQQRTPERVAHRRADTVRERTVYEAAVAEAEGRRAEIEVRGEGGLYVKELVHGDGGRTDPNLAAELGVGATVTALDVVAVEGEDESFEDPDYEREPPTDREPFTPDDG
ncbi:MAG: tRNA pseudouridine(54/55) synthase Pus10 [Halobacteriaceae archaeon]